VTRIPKRHVGEKIRIKIGFGRSKSFRLMNVALMIAVLSSILYSIPAAHAVGSFTLSPSPSIFYFFTGDPCDVSTLTVTSVGGFSGTVALRYIPNPGGTTGVSGPASITVPSGGSSQTDLSVCPGGSSGTFTWIINGSGGGFSTNTTITIREHICHSPPPCPT
jgi:hypothetical protein